MLIFICDDLPLKTCLSRKPQLCWKFCGLQPPCNLSHLRSLRCSAHYLWQPSSWCHCQLQRNHHYHLPSPHPPRWKHWRDLAFPPLLCSQPIHHYHRTLSRCLTCLWWPSQGHFICLNCQKILFWKIFHLWVHWALAWQAFLFLWGILRCREKREELQNEQAKHLIFQRQSRDFSAKILLQIHDLWTEFRSKTAKIILIRANLSSLQSCLFYRLDTVAKHIFRSCPASFRNNISKPTVCSWLIIDL